MPHKNLCLKFDIISIIRTSRVIYITNLYSDMIILQFIILYDNLVKKGKPITYTSYLQSILTKLVGLLFITKMTKVNKELELDTWM